MSKLRDPLFSPDFLSFGVKFSYGFAVIEVLVSGLIIICSDSEIRIWDVVISALWVAW